MGVYLGTHAVAMQGGQPVISTDDRIPQTKTVTPSDSAQEITADAGYVLTKVTVERVPNNQYAHISYNGSAIMIY